MVGKKSIGSKVFDVFNYILMLFMILITFYPFYYVAAGSLSDASQLVGSTFMLIPKGFSLKAYETVFSNPNILSGYRVTLIVVICGTALSIVLTAMGAFLLTREKFAIKNVMAYMMIFTMYFSGGMIPTFLLVYKYLGLGDNILALILPGAISTYNLIVMKSNFDSIPKSLEESAKIDGANEIIILFKIIIPVSLPIIAVMVLFYGVTYWNSWFNAMLYMRTRSKYPLQLILREVLIMGSMQSMDTTGADSYRLADTIKYATIMVATLPILCVYPFIQKYFVKGIMIGAVKG